MYFLSSWIFWFIFSDLRKACRNGPFIQRYSCICSLVEDCYFSLILEEGAPKHSCVGQQSRSVSERGKKKSHCCKSWFFNKRKILYERSTGNEMERGASSHPDRYNETEVTFPLPRRQRKINFPRYYKILWNAYSRTRSPLMSSLEWSKRKVLTEPWATNCCTDLAALVHTVPTGHSREDRMKQMFSSGRRYLQTHQQCQGCWSQDYRAICSKTWIQFMSNVEEWGYLFYGRTLNPGRE